MQARRGDAEAPSSPGRATARAGGRGATTEVALTALALLAYLALTVARLDRPGLNYDEVLFANAALGGYQPDLIPLSIGGVPILIHPYVGALKAWLFRPLLATLPPSLWTIRLPMVLCGAATLLVVRAAVTRLYDRWVALVCVWLLALDQSFLFMTLLDWGPVTLSLLLRAIALWLFARWWQSGSVRELVWLGAILVVGIFDKLHFVWFANAIAIAVPLARPQDARRLVAGLGKWTYAIAAALLAVAWLGIDWAHSLASDLGEQGFLALPTPGRLFRAAELVAATQNGTGVFAYVVGRLDFAAWPALLCLAIAATALLDRGARAAWLAPPTRAILAATVLVFLQLAITVPATGTHHAISVYPLVQILVAWCALGSFRRLREAWRERSAAPALERAGERSASPARSSRSAKIACGMLSSAALAAVLGYDLRRDLGFLSALGGRELSIAWSPANAALAVQIQRDPSHLFVIGDWGIFTQLLTLTGGRASLRESTFALMRLPEDPTERRRLRDDVLCIENARFVFHGERRAVFEDPKRNFFTLAREASLPVKRTGLVRDRHGIFAELYTVSCPAQSPPPG